LFSISAFLLTEAVQVVVAKTTGNFLRKSPRLSHPAEIARTAPKISTLCISPQGLFVYFVTNKNRPLGRFLFVL
jgi:hypothetical protein